MLVKLSKYNLQKSLKNRDLLQEFILDHAVYGFVFWEYKNFQELWVDKRFAADYHLRPGFTKLSKISDQEFKRKLYTTLTQTEAFVAEIIELFSDQPVFETRHQINDDLAVYIDRDELGANLHIFLTFKSPAYAKTKEIQEFSSFKELEAKESVELLSLVPKTTTSSVLITDPEGFMIYVNESFVKMTGYTRVELIGKKPGDILQGELTKQEDIKSFSDKLASRKPFTQEILNYSKNGRPYFITCFVNPVFDSNGALTNYIAIQRDISEERENYNFLETFKKTLDRVEDCIFLFDEKSLELFYVNEGAAKMTGYTQEQLLYKHPYDLKPNFSRKKCQELLDSLPEGEERSYRFHTIHRNKSGKDIPVEIFLQYINQEGMSPFYVSIVHDISKRLEKNRKLKQLSLVAKNTTNLVVITDAEGNVEFVNEGFEKKTGYTLEEIKGRRPGEFLHGPKTNPLHIKANKAGLRKNISFTQEILNYTKSAETYWVSITFNPVFNEENELINYIAIETDITSRKEDEKSLQEYISIVEEQNERLRNFTYIVSHNLRSHSSNIHGLLDLMLRKNTDYREDKYFNFLKKASNKLEDTLHHLNDIVSVVSSKQEMTNLNLNSFINGFQSAFDSLLEKEGVRMVNEVDDEVQVKAVPEFLESVVTNLISNAIKYRDKRKDSYVQLYAKTYKGAVVLFVKDNGLGMDLEQYGNKVFGMYKTFHQHKDARGIGLFLTKNQVESMGGKIKVESKINKGSIFKVLFKNGKI